MKFSPSILGGKIPPLFLGWHPYHVCFQVFRSSVKSIIHEGGMIPFPSFCNSPESFHTQRRFRNTTILSGDLVVKYEHVKKQYFKWNILRIQSWES